MMSKLKVGYALLAVQGLLSVLAPHRAIALATTAWRAGFENVGGLEPRGWYVEVTRVLGVGMVVAGLTGLLVDAAGDDADSTGDGESGVDAEEPADSDGPIRVDVD